MMPENKADTISEAREELRRLAVSIVDAYEMRVGTISGMMREAYKLVKSYDRDVGNALSILRDNMAKGQSLRRCDFDKIIGDVTTARASRQQQVSEHLNAFAEEEKEMIMRLRRIVANGNASDLSDLRKIHEDILVRQKSRERQVIGILRKFEIDEHELRTMLRWLLDKGQKATVVHLRNVVKTLSARWGAKEREIFDVVEQLEKVRSGIRARWQQVVDAST